MIWFLPLRVGSHTQRAIRTSSRPASLPVHRPTQRMIERLAPKPRGPDAFCRFHDSLARVVVAAHHVSLCEPWWDPLFLSLPYSFQRSSATIPQGAWPARQQVREDLRERGLCLPLFGAWHALGAATASHEAAGAPLPLGRISPLLI
jgi:hypothetical protein